MTRLRKQLSERVVTRPEPELTAALVQKQETIEHLTVELSQMRLQLERVKVSIDHFICKINNGNHLFSFIHLFIKVLFFISSHFYGL